MKTAEEIRGDAKRQMEAAVASTEESLGFQPPENYQVHLNRLASRCCQIGIDMALALKKLEAGS